MDEDFAEWYRQGGLVPNGDSLLKRWAAVESFEVSAEDIVALTGLFYRLGDPSAEFVTKFRAAFQEADPSFPMRNNDQELAVLAGAVLAVVVDSDSRDLADFAALTLVTAAVQNLRAGPPVREIPERAALQLSKRSNDRVPFETTATDSDDEPPGVRALHKELAIVAEECNILWWLFSEHSRDEGKRWTDFGVPEASLMAGKELGDLARAIPGPPSTLAFLGRVIRCVKNKIPSKVGVVDAINALSPDWRKKFAAKTTSIAIQQLIPISAGIRISLTAPDNNAWTPAFTRETGVSSSATIPPDELAYQMFLELLLIRQWEALN